MNTAGPISVYVCSAVCAATLLASPWGVFAQESSDSDIVPPDTAVIIQKEYTTERLPGDEVFGDFVVGPGKTEVTLVPGQSYTTEILVTNRTGETRVFNFETEDIKGSENGDVPVKLLGDDTGPYSLRDYLDIPQGGIELDHAQRARVPVTIHVPADAEPGGLYGSVLVTTVTKKGEEDTGLNAVPTSPIVSRIGTLFFITVPGDIAYDGLLEKFATIPNTVWFQKGPIHFEILYKNAGSVHVNPYGELSVVNIFGEEVGYIEIKPWYALPQSLRFREVIWDREFLFGRYTARVAIHRGYDDIIDEMEVSFWVIPWHIIAIGFGILFLVIFLIRVFFRTFEFKRKSD